VLPKESASSGSITAYHLVRVSTVPKDAPTINQWSGAHQSASRTSIKAPSRWLLGVLLLSWVGAGSLAWSLASSQSAALTPELAAGAQANSLDANAAMQGEPVSSRESLAEGAPEAVRKPEVE